MIPTPPVPYAETSTSQEVRILATGLDSGDTWRLDDVEIYEVAE